jgi:chromosome segregation ATPase
VPTRNIAEVEEAIIKRLDIHRKELTTMEECTKQCQISIGQHDERLRAYEENSKRQNGTLDKLSEDIDSVAHGVNDIVKKVDAMDTSIANRVNEIERNGIKRDATSDIAVRERADTREVHIRAEVDNLTKEIAEVKRLGGARMAEIERIALKSAAEHEQCAIDRIAAAREESGDEIAALRVEFIKQQSEAMSNIQWKIIAALSSLAFLFILVFISYSFHVFGGLP